MYNPVVATELDTLIGYADQQLDAIRAAAYGLTEVQVRETPCRSALSIGGIIKHTAHGMSGVITTLDTDGAPPALDAAAFADYQAHFVLAEDESGTEVLATFDEVRERFRSALAATDPDADRLAPPAPWHGIFDPRPIKARYYLVHQVEEFARHAGHADIIREQLDGTSVATLVMTREGVPANDFFQPFRPAPGTLTA